MHNILIIFMLVVLDYYGKEYSRKNYKNNSGKKVFFGKIIFCYVENRGIAFNFLTGRKRLIIFSNVLLLFYILYLFFQIPTLQYSLLLIFSGGIGNLLDRIKRGYVIDYIFFKIKKWPVFNLSDFYVFFGVLLSFFLD